MSLHHGLRLSTIPSLLTVFMAAVLWISNFCSISSSAPALLMLIATDTHNLIRDTFVATNISNPIIKQAYAQSVPLPPPPPGPQVGVEPSLTGTPKKDYNSPKIEVVTDRLTQGKDVVRVRITDGSNIAVVTASYVHQGRIVTVALVQDVDNIYKGLVDVSPPSSVMLFDVADDQGNKAEVVKWFTVDPSPANILEQFLHWLMSVFHLS